MLIDLPEQWQVTMSYNKWLHNMHASIFNSLHDYVIFRSADFCKQLEPTWIAGKIPGWIRVMILSSFPLISTQFSPPQQM